MNVIYELLTGHHLIRIDYSQINTIYDHISKALQIFNKGQMIYYSNPDMYKYIIHKS